MIPKIIHQTWKTDEIPDKWTNAVQTCKSVNSDFKYILWTDETMNNFVKKYYPSFYKTYNSYKYINKTEIFGCE
jgi:mannosyltransferase OCH1-like enzyme